MSRFVFRFRVPRVSRGSNVADPSSSSVSTPSSAREGEGESKSAPPSSGSAPRSRRSSQSSAAPPATAAASGDAPPAKRAEGEAPASRSARATRYAPEVFVFVVLVNETRSGSFSSVEDAAATSGGEQVGAERRALFWRENATSSGVRPSRSRASREKTRFFSWLFSHVVRVVS
jgi:hypothetical protein